MIKQQESKFHKSATLCDLSEASNSHKPVPKQNIADRVLIAAIVSLLFPFGWIQANTLSYSAIEEALFTESLKVASDLKCEENIIVSLDKQYQLMQDESNVAKSGKCIFIPMLSFKASKTTEDSGVPSALEFHLHELSSMYFELSSFVPPHFCRFWFVRVAEIGGVKGVILIPSDFQKMTTKEHIAPMVIDAVRLPQIVLASDS